MGGLFLTPIIVRSLGVAEYGLYSLVGAFVGYLSLLDFGFSNTIVRYIAMYREAEDKDGEANFLGAILFVYAIICIVAIIIGLYVKDNIGIIFKSSLSSSQIEPATIIFNFFLLNICLSLPTSVFTAICNGCKKFSFPNNIRIAKFAARFVLVLFWVVREPTSVTLVKIDTILNLFILLISIFYTFTTCNIYFSFNKIKISFVYEIFKFSVWVFIYNIVYQFQWRSGQFILGINSSSTDVISIYSIGVTLGLYYSTIGGVINNLILPTVVKDIQLYSVIDLNNSFIRYSRLTMLMLMLMLGVFLCVGHDFILIWVGHDFVDAWLISLIIMFAFVMSISTGYLHSYLEVCNRLWVKSIASLLFSVLGAAIGWYLSKDYGALGYIIGVATSITSLNIFMQIFFYLYTPFNMLSYWKSSILPFFIVFVLTCLIIKGIRCFYYFESTISNFLFFGLLYVLVYCAIIVIFRLYSNEEKDLMNRVLFNMRIDFKL